MTTPIKLCVNNKATAWTSYRGHLIFDKKLLTKGVEPSSLATKKRNTFIVPFELHDSNEF
jgi:hypothetical protein